LLKPILLCPSHPHPLIAPSPPHPLLEGKPQEPRLDVLKLIKVMKEINLLPLKGHEVLTKVKTNKFGDVTCAKYKSVTPHTTIDGVQAMPDQVKVVPQWRGKGRCHHHLSQRLRSVQERPLPS
jgi:hypothetical protein